MDSKTISVLLIEDSPSDMHLVRMLLANGAPTRLELHHVGTLEAGLDYLAQHVPDVILLDLFLPDGSGMEVFNRLEAQSPAVPVVVLTGFASEDRAVEAFQAGAQEFLSKETLSAEQLWRTIRYAIERQRFRQEARENQARLRASESRLRTIVQETTDALLVVGQDRRIRFANPAAERLFGRAAEALVGSPLGYPLAPDGVTEVDIVHPQQTMVAADMRAAEVNWDGESAYLVSLVDITARKQAEEALRDRERRFRALIENGADAIVLVNRAGRLQYVSPVVHRMLGYEAEAITGRRVLDFVHPDDRAYLEQRFIEAREAPAGYVLRAGVRLLHLDGSVRWVSGAATNALADPSIRAVVLNFHNVTELKQAEAEARRSEETLRLALEATHTGVWYLDRRANRLYWDERVAELFGFPPSEAPTTHQAYLDMIHPDDRDRIAAAYAQYFETGAYEELEYRVCGPAGATRWIQERGKFLPNTSGQPMNLLGVAFDITERKRAEETLRRRAEELAAVAEVSAALRLAATRAEMAPIILRKLREVLETDAAGIGVCDPVNGDLVVELALDAWAPLTGKRLPLGAGLAGHVMITGLPYLVTDTRAEPRLVYRELIDLVATAVFVPLKAHAEPFGVLFAGRNSPLAETDQRLLGAIAEMAGSALHRAALHEQTERRLERLAALSGIERAINSSLDLRVTLGYFLDQVVRQLDVDAADVLLLNPHTQLLQYAAGTGFRAHDIERSRVRLGEGLAGTAALERRLIRAPRLERQGVEVHENPLLANEGFISYYVVPLIAKGQVKGVLDIYCRSSRDVDQEWLDFLESLAGQAATAIDNTALFEALQRTNIDLRLAYDVTLEGWSRALDLRDKETEGHTQRVAQMTEQLARAMRISDEDLVHIRRGALLHDIGKIGIPDAILLKPGPLTAEERKIIERHPMIAYELLAPIAHLRPALDIPQYHHEKWDGTGYPYGLAGEQIPLAARIFAVADVWDALSSARPYRAAWPEAAVLEYIRGEAGKHFDPRVVELALSQFEAVADPAHAVE